MQYVSQAISSLRLEVARLEAIIGTLEGLQQPALPLVKRRGRKFMGTEERQQVSQRMRQYWAQRRKETQVNGRTTATRTE